jgi:16S rRNA A1518/A1519 N6-dimethyltransferase RsmA/KsgA/DIM1 with predicted DNA glycosylase/AP lyase activity
LVAKERKMSDNVLQEIRSGLGAIQSGLVKVEQRLTALEVHVDTRLTSVEKHLAAVEQRLTTLEVHVNAMDIRLIHDLKEINAGFRRMRAQDELLDARLDEMQARIERLEGRVQ